VNELALFSGAGGGILGGHLLGWRTVCAVEWEPYPASVLCARQNDKVLPPFPVWDDVQTFDGRPWRGVVDVVSGGFPCQDISAAGKGAGIDGARSGMWGHMARIIGEVRPRYVYVENSPLLTKRGIHRVLGDLAAMGFDARWGVVSAAAVGAPHKRDRIWIVANSTSVIGNEWGTEPKGQQWEAGVADGSNDLADSNSSGCEAQRLRAIGSGEGGQVVICGGEVADSDNKRVGWWKQQSQSSSSEGNVADSGDIGSRSSPTDRELEGNQRPTISSLDCEWWDREPGQTSREVESNLGRVAHGVAARVDRLKAIGNGQVPLVAATAWDLLSRS
jgi:DNA (cytosine-5)-methyltransferase 1